MQHKTSMHMVGRILFGLPLLVFGVLHFTNMQMMTGMVPDYIPGESAWVIITGILMILAGLGIIARKFVREMSIVVVVMLAVFVVLVHLPNFSSNLPSLLKDVALIGGALMMMSRYPKHRHEG